MGDLVGVETTDVERAVLLANHSHTDCHAFGLPVNLKKPFKINIYFSCCVADGGRTNLARDTHWQRANQRGETKCASLVPVNTTMCRATIFTGTYGGGEGGRSWAERGGGLGPL